MRALIVYDTLTGQTEKVAHAISDGMKEAGFVDVIVMRAKRVEPEYFASSDVWIIGSPTHLSTATHEIRGAVKTAVKGGVKGKRAVVFDTRIAGVGKGANDKIVPILSEAGVQLVCEPCSFIVDKYLESGEEMKAVEFGKRIANALSQ